MRFVLTAAFAALALALPVNFVAADEAREQVPLVQKAGKKVKWTGQECTPEELAPILKAWPGYSVKETDDALDYYPPSDLWEVELTRIRPTGPKEIITPGGGSQSVPVAPIGGCPNGRCPIR